MLHNNLYDISYIEIKNWLEFNCSTNLAPPRSLASASSDEDESEFIEQTSG